MQLFKRKKSREKGEQRAYLKAHLTDYYKTIEGEGIKIPAFMLAEREIRRIEREGSLEFWYGRLKEQWQGKRN